MRVVYISDTTYWRVGEQWHTALPWPANFMAERLRATTITFVGRVVANGVGEAQPPRTENGCVVRVMGVPVQRHGPLGYVLALPALRKLLAATLREADVAYIKPGVLSLIAEQMLTPRHTVVYHQVGELGVGLRAIYPQFGWLTSVLQAHARRLRQRANVVAFVSHALAQQYADGRRDIVVSNESRVRAADVVASARHTIHDPPRVMYMGRLSPEKGVALIPTLCERLPDVEFVIAGDGASKTQLISDLKKNGCLSRVTLLGRVAWGKDIFRALRSADVLILPSYTEGLPLVLAEAMSQGIPCVASAVGGVPEIVKHGVNGFVVPPGDAEAFAQALGRASQDADFRSAAAHATLETAHKHTLEQQAGPLLDRVRTIYEEKRRGM